ncbi:MAG: DinB family protein [Ginsengibacter sp.]
MSAQNSLGTYPEYFYRYIRLVENENLNDVLKKQLDEASQFFNSIPEEKYLYKYDEGKWSVKEVLQHIIDTERVFSYRSFVFSRKDPNIFPSFDENAYAENSNADSRKWQDLINEFIAVRNSTADLFKSFSEEQLMQAGKASNYEMSVKALGYTTAGHFQHHVNILKERYLQ